jgi:rhodanese-related sulfurtransferase
MKKVTWLLTIVMLLSLALTACGGGDTAVVEEPAVVNNTETQVEEPVVEEEPAGFDVASLDAAFGAFLADMQAYNTIGLDALNTALVENPPFLLDVRNPDEVEESGYIEGSVLIPLRDLADNLAYLPSFDTPIVSYCGSGWRCTIALTVLEAMGWQDVKGLKGGSFGGWQEAGYAVVEGLPAEAEMLNAAEVDEDLVIYFDDVMTNLPEGWGVVTAEALNTKLVEVEGLTLIDVRTAAEVEEYGAIDYENTIYIPLEDFINQKADWPAMDTPIVVYCGTGHRSTIAATILWSYGFTDVGSLKSGFGEWKGEGYPVAGGAPDLDAAFEVFLADMEAYNTISLDALNTALVENPPFLLDVRNLDETEAAGHIEGSVLIPLRDLADNLAYLPSFDTPIVSYCGSGWRCTIALTMLEAMGWQDVKGLKGGSFGGWKEGGYAFVEGLPAEAEMLNAAEVDPAVAAVFDEALANLPEGWGVVPADVLNTMLLENPDVILIDVRTTAELEENGVIEAANWIHIPLEEFVTRQAEWPADTAAKIVVYCGTGHRSTIGMTILYSYGYTDVGSLKDGFGGWTTAGFPVGEYTP